MERVYNHEKSIFGSYKIDTSETAKECFDYDSKFWKLGRFIKNEEILKQFEEWLKQNYQMMINLYRFAISWCGQVTNIDNYEFRKYVIAMELV